MTIVGQVRYCMELNIHRSVFLQLVIYDNFVEIVLQIQKHQAKFRGCGLL